MGLCVVYIVLCCVMLYYIALVCVHIRYFSLSGLMHLVLYVLCINCIDCTVCISEWHDVIWHGLQLVVWYAALRLQQTVYSVGQNRVVIAHSVHWLVPAYCDTSMVSSVSGSSSLHCSHVMSSPSLPKYLFMLCFSGTRWHLNRSRAPQCCGDLVYIVHRSIPECVLNFLIYIPYLPWSFCTLSVINLLSVIDVNKCVTGCMSWVSVS